MFVELYNFDVKAVTLNVILMIFNDKAASIIIPFVLICSITFHYHYHLSVLEQHCRRIRNTVALYPRGGGGGEGALP